MVPSDPHPASAALAAASPEYIVTTPGTCGGRPRIAGTRVSVENIAVCYEDQGRTPAAIAADYDLTLAQVHAALAYYYDHQTGVRSRQRQRLAYAEELQGNQPSLATAASLRIKARLEAADGPTYAASLSSGSVLVYLRSGVCAAEHRALFRTDLARRLAASPEDPDTLELQAELATETPGA